MGWQNWQMKALKRAITIVFKNLNEKEEYAGGKWNIYIHINSSVILELKNIISEIIYVTTIYIYNHI